MVLVHYIPLDLVLKIDQILLSDLLPGKYTFCLKGATTVPITRVDRKRQITATVSATVVFLTIQLIYQDKTKISLPNIDFQRNFTSF